jgi:hypothetical protein
LQNSLGRLDSTPHNLLVRASSKVRTFYQSVVLCLNHVRIRLKNVQIRLAVSTGRRNTLS